MSDNREAFEKWFLEAAKAPIDPWHKEFARSVWQAALASQAKEIEEVRALLRSGTEDLNKAAAALAAKDAEIESWRNHHLDAQKKIARLQRVVNNPTYYAWLIEQRDANGKPTWLKIDNFIHEQTDNAWEALHFGRKVDAEAYAAGNEDEVIYITEHVFPALKFAQQEG